MAVLGYDNKTANGTVTIPDGCNYVVAACVGTTAPPYLNGVLMQPYSTVPATGILKAIGIHILPNSINQELPFVMNGADSISFIYLDDSVCTRLPAVEGYSAAGSVSGNLVTSTNDLVIGIVLGSNGQVLIKGDTVALTLVYDTLTCRIGYITPGDSVLACLATDESTTSGYWYTPPPVWINTTTSVLVEPGHWVTTSVYHREYYAFNSQHPYGYFIYGVYEYVNPPGSTTFIEDFNSATYFGSQATIGTWYTYYQTWVPDRYETVSSGYWQPQEPQWIQTGVSGQISCCFISIADVMIGTNYISRPLIC